MSDQAERHVRSIELSKSGFDNAQARITAIDSKVGVAVGFLAVLLPTPLVLAGWLSGLQNAAATNIYWACCHFYGASLLAGGFMFLGMICAFFSILSGFGSLTPRGPTGYGKKGLFENEWRPNSLFPLHEPERVEIFCLHIRKLKSGVDIEFIHDEYHHQLEQLGRILNEKFFWMRTCFTWLKLCMFSYGIAIFFATYIAVRAALHGAGYS